MMPDSNLRQPADLEQLARARFGPLSDAEIRLLRASPKGETAYCGPSGRDDDPNNNPAHSDNWDSERWISAELIRWLCVDRDAKDRVDPRGIRAHAAGIKGKLDLSFVAVPFFLGLLRCSFSDDLDLRFIEIPSLDLSGTCLPSLNADHATVKGSISLQGLWSKGTVQLRGVQIGGNLECDGGKFHNPALASVSESGIALIADGARVARDVLLRNGFAAEGVVRLCGAEIGGNLCCDRGEFQNPAKPGIAESGIALQAENARVTGDVLLRNGFAADGMVWLSGAEIGGNLACDGGKFQNPAQANVAESGMALIAEGSKVARSVLLRHGFAAEGQVWLFGAKIGGNFECDGGKFQNPAQANVAESGMALSAQGARVAGDVLLRNGFAAEGIVCLFGAEIGGNLFCDGGRFQNPVQPGITGGGMALEATNARVRGDVLLRNGFAAEGAVWLFGAEIGGVLACDGGKFHNPVVADVTASGTALSAEGAKVARAVYLRNGFAAEGKVRLFGAEIGGTLECHSCTFESLDVGNASAGAILDDEESWPKPGKLFLDGFAYGRIAGGPIAATKRLAWLARQASFTRQPYRQFAKVLKEAGDDQGWRRVCAEMERRTWEGRSWIARPFSYLLRATISYGYFSMRALWWLLALVIVGSIVYWRGYEAGSIVPTGKDAYDSFAAGKGLPGNYEAFHALPYSLENSFPLVKFGVQDKWAPGPGELGTTRQPVGWTSRFLLRIASSCFLRWFRWGQICAGWILATLFVGGVTGVIRKD